MLSKRFGENLFDEMFDDPFELMPMFSRHNPLYGKHGKNLMKTDVRDVGDHYELDMDLPGFKKDEIHAELENGYLTISAEKSLDKDEKDKAGHYIRRERSFGRSSRTFFVGDGVKESDIKAKYADGILKLSIPKKELPQSENKKMIAIEG